MTNAMATKSPATPAATSCAQHEAGETGFCTFHCKVPFGTALYLQPPQPVDVVEQIAQQWDGCNYEAPGETIDIGADIRAAGKQLLAEQLVQNVVPSLEFSITEARALLDFFGGHDASVTVELHPDRIDGGRMHFAGLYAFFTDCPEEGSAFLGHVEVQEGDDDRATRVETVPEALPNVEEASVSRFDFFLNTHGITLGRDAARTALAHILDGRQ